MTQHRSAHHRPDHHRPEPDRPELRRPELRRPELRRPGLHRRGFLAGLGAGAVTLASANQVSAFPARPRGRGAMPPDWQALRAVLGDRLVLPGDPGYPIARLGFNELNDGQLPAAIAKCACPDEVRACLDVARGHGIPIAARSGGHSYLGYSIPAGGLVIDLRAMARVVVNPDGTAEVGAGARLIDVYAGLAAQGRLLPAGSCPTVGVSGLTLGGGIGVLARKYGLTCDRLAAAELVLADSGLCTASPTEEPDLHWALRGGGGGNFGIVTRFSFDTAPAPGLTVFVLGFPATATTEVLGAWQPWVAGAPFELWASCQVSGGTPPSCRIVGCWVGDPDEANAQLDRLVRAVGTAPATRTVAAKDYLDAMKFMAGCAKDTIAQCHPTWEGGRLGRTGFVAVSRMLGPTPLDPAAVTELMTGRSGVDLLLDSLGGAVGEPAPDATAFPHRDSLASAQVYVSATPATEQQARTTADAVRDGLAGLGARGAYVNYIDATLPDWGRAYYGANLPRLQAVARRYDPDGVFAFPQSVTAA
ncbi:FAD-binding dehydrogenase [Streptomyces tateyamensis]|uniref:FAD-binding dehydrogenase n=1 Tax=Streptomyces tateyamensis TaxID=565073 RepID=A0A2V4NUA5_9ACTN|nr:FAD-binding oxidoreductase [Streptomyces tateyamensis]PYC80254.1 FAD-binding dehydrogenase [Streptomyces tateyamensis]